MSIVTVANLKGGVGKTALAVNLAHALSKRLCETLVIDFDPQGDASYLLSRESRKSPSPAASSHKSESSDLFQRFVSLCRSQIEEVRAGLSLLNLQRIASRFDLFAAEGELLSNLIDRLSLDYDHVVIDTPPVWSDIHKAALRPSDLLVIPVDPSEMSVRAAVQCVQRANEISPGAALLVRTLVSKRAKRIARQSLRRINEVLPVDESSILAGEDRSLLPPKRVTMRELPVAHLPLYLSQLALFRSELIHGLSYQRKTVFESSGLELLQQCYMALAREVEELSAMVKPEKVPSGLSASFEELAAI